MTPALRQTFTDEGAGLTAAVYATGPTFRIVSRDIDADETIAVVNGIASEAAALRRAHALAFGVAS